jgi:hypothetical protein
MLLQAKTTRANLRRGIIDARMYFAGIEKNGSEGWKVYCARKISDGNDVHSEIKTEAVDITDINSPTTT